MSTAGQAGGRSGGHGGVDAEKTSAFTRIYTRGENMQNGFLQHLGESWPSQALLYGKQAQRIERL